MMQVEDLYQQKKSLELDWQQDHLKAGRYNLNMIHIDHKIKEVIAQIKAEEARIDDLENKIIASKPEVTIAT